MRIQIPLQNSKHSYRQNSLALLPWTTLLVGLAWLTATSSMAAPITLFTNGFDSAEFTAVGVATSESDLTNANPPLSIALNSVKVLNDRATPQSVYSGQGNGVQVINWDSFSAPNSIIIRPGASINCNVYPRSGATNYVWEWKMKTRKSDHSNLGFRCSLSSSGSDANNDGTDFVVFRTIQTATTNTINGVVSGNAPNNTVTNSGINGVDGFQAFNGIANTVLSNRWVTMTNFLTGERAYVTNNVWNHYRVIADNASRTFKLYFNDMVTPISTNFCARQEEMVVSGLFFANEGSNTNKDYILIDDVSLIVDGNLVDLTSTITEGFESYPAAASPTDDADPQGAWVVAETTGVGGNTPANPGKVQVVSTEFHTGGKSLKLEGGQRAGASLAWGATPLSDVKITWWAKVPVGPGTGESLYLRVSAYGFEARCSGASDTVLLGYGSRPGINNPVASTGTTLSGFNHFFNLFSNGAFLNSLENFTAAWEEYQLITHFADHTYTILRNGSVVMTNYPFLANAAVPNTNMFMIAFNSSNGSGHPPVYIDDITIESFNNTATSAPRPYTPVNTGTRFKSYSIVKVPGHVVAGVAVDPRNDNILFTTDEEEVGAIWRAQKVAHGKWALDASPIVTGLDRPKGITVGTNGTIWWTHGQGPQSLRRLKEPWATSAVEEVISDFGAAPANTRDEPIALTLVVTNGVTTLAVLDRSVNGVNPMNAIYLVDPATTSLNQMTYQNYLISPTANGLGGVAVPVASQCSAIATLQVSNEVVTVADRFGWIVATDGSGVRRDIDTLVAGFDTNSQGNLCIAVDPTDNRVWVGGKSRFSPSTNATPAIWSFGSAVADSGDGRQEALFPRDNPNGGRPDLNMRLHEAGMAFSTNGSFLVVSDQNYVSGGGRLVFLHNEAITITNIVRGVNVDLAWTLGGGVRFSVQRSSTVNGTYTTIATGLTTPAYTDTTAPAGEAYYRVLGDTEN